MTKKFVLLRPVAGSEHEVYDHGAILIPQRKINGWRHRIQDVHLKDWFAVGDLFQVCAQRSALGEGLQTPGSFFFYLPYALAGQVEACADFV